MSRNKVTMNFRNQTSIMLMHASNGATEGEGWKTCYIIGQ